MMTIKEFAGLCRCGTQTLRYYDRIGLLKPVRVDQWSGYRYYEQRQAIDFVKIKNLQAADVRKCGLISLPSWLIYNIVAKSVGATVCEILALVSIVVGMARHDKEKQEA